MSRANRAWSPRRLAAAAALALALTVGLSAILPAGNAIAAGSYPAQPTPPDPPDPTPDPQPTPDPDPTPDPQPTPDPEPTPDPQPTPGPQPTVVPTDPALVPDPAAEAAAAAAELARDRAQDAAERAADLAAAQSRTTDAWVSRGRPERMIVVRDLSIETVSNGKLTAQIPRSGGALTLGGLDRLAPDGWVTMAADAARLSATVVLTPGASLDLGGVKTLRLAGGATVPEAASIYSGSGRLIARDVTVTSVDPDTDQAMGPAAGRPFVVVSAGGRLDATDATFSDLGTLPTDPENHGGVQFNDGATGSLTRATMRRNSVGLRLAGTDGIKVDGLLVEESAADGLVLEGDRGTTITQVRAERNGADGVLIKGEGTAGRTISGIATTGNKGYGLSVIGQKAPKIIGVVTTADATGGLRVNRSSQVQVVDFTATDQPIGIFTHVGSKDLRFERITITGGRRGVVVEKSTSGLVMRESTIDGASVVGVGIGGHDVSLDGLSVAGARTGVKIERGAANVTATGLSLSGGEDGFVANPGSTAVVLRDLVAQGIGNDAVRTYSPEMQIVGARLTGADTGVVAAAATVVSNTAITEVETGLRARGTGVVMADRIDVAALTLGIDAAPGSSTQLKDSKVQALEALRGPVQLLGHNELSLPPLNLLGAIGMPLILLAIALELVHALRQRRFQRPGRGVPPVAVPAGA